MFFHFTNSNSKEGWVLKNWCFQTVMLEKTLESPLDSKITPVNSKGNQPWIFIGRTNTEAETAILGHLMWRTDSFEKTLNLGKIEGGTRRGQQRMRWLDGITYSMGIQFSSVAQLCLTYCDAMNHRTPGLPVHHQLPEFIQTHVHRGSDAIRPSHPLSSPSPPAFNLSQLQGLFKWVSSSHQVAKVLFSFSISPSNECSGPISFRTDWFDILEV